MAKYINHEALAADGWYLQRHIYREGTVYVENMNLLDVPTADGCHVVLCQDCRHYRHCMIQDFMEDYGITPDDQNNFFCGYGEREEQT